MELRGSLALERKLQRWISINCCVDDEWWIMEGGKEAFIAPVLGRCSLRTQDGG